MSAVAIKSRAKKEAPRIEVVNPPCPWDIMLPYQKKWHADTSRFKLWLKSRQIGGSAGVAAEPVEFCMAFPRDNWVIGSVTEALAKEFLRRVNAWTDILKSAVRYHAKEFELADVIDEKTGKAQKAFETCFENGSRIIAVAANPRSIRSFSANVVLDEAAHLENSHEIYQAAYPMVTRGNKKMRLVSSANGKFNVHYKIRHGENDYSKHLTTIYDAVKDGLEVDPESLKRNLGNERSWRQEYLCEELDDATGDTLIMHDWVKRCVMDEARARTMWQDGRACAYIDIAYSEGGAESVFACKRGNRVLPLRTFQGDPDATVEFFIGCFRKPDPGDTSFTLLPQQIKADAGGGGSVIISMLQKRGWTVGALSNNGPAADERRFANRVTEVWHHAAVMIQRGEVILPDDDLMVEQLCTRKLAHDERNRMKLESKRLLTTSPDRADAVVEVLAANPQLVVGTVGRQPESSYKFDKNFNVIESEFGEDEDLERAPQIPGAWAGL